MHSSLAPCQQCVNYVWTVKIMMAYFFSHRFHADAAYPRGHSQRFSPTECVQAAAGYQLCVRDSRFFFFPGSAIFLLLPGAGRRVILISQAYAPPYFYPSLLFVPLSSSPHWISCSVVCYLFCFFAPSQHFSSVSLLGGKWCMRWVRKAECSESLLKINAD